MNSQNLSICGLSWLPAAWRVSAAVLASLAIAGCGSEVSIEPEPAGTWKDGEQFTLVRTEGNFSLVEASDGNRGFVPTDRLIRAGTALAPPVAGDTLVVTARTQYFVGDSPPQDIPPPPEPRTAKEISKVRDRLPRLFLTEKTSKEVYADRRAPEPFIDKESGEKCWSAMTCINPKCPGRNKGKDGRPFLFIWANPNFEVNEKGEFVHVIPGEGGRDDTSTANRDGDKICPACAKIRDLANETPEQQKQYERWVRPYRLPEAKARKKALSEEHRARIRLDKIKK